MLILTGPAPLLPKPPPMQAYALIPIASGSLPVVAPQPVVMSSWAMPAGTAAPTIMSSSSASTITTQTTCSTPTATVSKNLLSKHGKFMHYYSTLGAPD